MEGVIINRKDTSTPADSEAGASLREYKAKVPRSSVLSRYPDLDSQLL